MKYPEFERERQLMPRMHRFLDEHPFLYAEFLSKDVVPLKLNIPTGFFRNDFKDGLEAEISLGVPEEEERLREKFGPDRHFYTYSAVQIVGSPDFNIAKRILNYQLGISLPFFVGRAKLDERTLTEEITIGDYDLTLRHYLSTTRMVASWETRVM